MKKAFICVSLLGMFLLCNVSSSFALQECTLTVRCGDGFTANYGSSAAYPCRNGPTDFDRETCEHVCFPRNTTIQSCTVAGNRKFESFLIDMIFLGL